MIAPLFKVNFWLDLKGKKQYRSTTQAASFSKKAGFS